MPSFPRRQALGALYAVHRRGEDAAGVARALAAGVEAAHGALAALVALDAHGRTGARLRAGEQRARVGKALQAAVEEADGLAHVAHGVVGKAAGKVCVGDAGAVGGRDVARARRGDALQKVADALGRGAVIPARQLERPLLPFPLEAHAGERVVSGEVRGRDGDEQGAVGVFAIAGEGAHAVGDHAARFRGRRHHRAARAHAERVGGAAVGQVGAEAVLRRRQGRVAGAFAVLGQDRRAPADARCARRWKTAWATWERPVCAAWRRCRGRCGRRRGRRSPSPPPWFRLRARRSRRARGRFRPAGRSAAFQRALPRPGARSPGGWRAPRRAGGPCPRGGALPRGSPPARRSGPAFPALRGSARP